MLIDTSQKGNILAVSYANPHGSISIKEFDIKQTNGYGSYDYQICDEDDPDKEQGLRHFKDNQSIKKVPTWRLDFDELREFLLVSIPEEDRNDIFAFKVPDMYMCDIEIATGKDDVFPDPALAAKPIDSIQITSPDFRTVTLSCNPRVMQDNAQIYEIEELINQHYSAVDYVWEKTDRLQYAHIKFDTEKEMLEFFWKMVNEKLHSVSFWNGDRFDIPYLWNRCPKLGVDMAMGSPTGEISSFNNWPKHRYVNDYMLITEKYGAWDLFPMTSVGLDWVTNRIFGVGKVSYKGSYYDLYSGPINTFMLYGAVDTINMQLIHQRKKYSMGKEALVFYTRTSMFDSNKVTAQVHALIWDELYKKGQINAEPYTKKDKKPFPGGYVKTPARKYALYSVCVDFSALYPRIMQSHNMSFENYRGFVKDKAHADELTKQGYYVSVNGTYYDNDKDYTLKTVETKLLEERYDYKNLQMDVFLKVQTSLEKEMKRRGIQITK
jgi:DNA polymerase elongation subunit (family B)